MTHAFDIKRGRHLFFRRKTILVFRRLLVAFFIFIQIFKEHSVSKRWIPYDQTRRCAASDLDLHCLPMSHKKEDTLVWFIKTSMDLSVLYFKGSQVEIS